MSRYLPLVVMLVLLFGGTVAVAQDHGDAATVEISGQVSGLTALTEIEYAGTVYQFSEADGTIAVGFVQARTTTTAGSELSVVLFVHDSGWRSVGVLTGEATGELAAAVAGDVLQLSVIGDGVE